jgi:glycolate oxidase FAD binding subunit
VICPEPSELQELVRELHRQALPWLPSGLGSRLDWGPAVHPASAVVSTARLDRILDHNPGDFTVTVQAGMPLLELQRQLAQQRQWLTVDWPWGSGPGGGGSGSVGGLVARGLAGGYRLRHLGLRDQLIGIGLLRADGTAARAGGRVVKNVAGYDLMRLLTGSWGSLALITEVTLRTQPLPPERRGLWLQGELADLAAFSRWLLGSSLSPERLDWQLASGSQAGLGLLVSLASISAQTLQEQISCIAANAAEQNCSCSELDVDTLNARLVQGVAVQAVPVQAFPVQAVANAQPGPTPPRGGGSPVNPDLPTHGEPAHGELPTQGKPAHGEPAPSAGGWLLRLAVPPDRLAELVGDAARAGLALTGEAGSGLAMAWAEPQQLPGYRVEALRRRTWELGGYLTVLRQPPSSAMAAWLDAPSRPLIEAVKRQFDPLQQLARGRLPGVQPTPLTALN